MTDAQPRHDDDVTPHDEGGFVLIWFALLMIVMIGMAGFGVDLWRWWHTAGEVQKAADAGALAGAVFLPSDPTSANDTALDLVEANGFPRTEATAGALSTNGNQIRVTVTHEVKNSFTSIFGLNSTTITREATAEFQGPVPLGSPANNMGNQPVGPGEQAWTTPGAGVPNTNPRLWGNLAGPNTNKQNGDRFATSFCSGAANCTGSVNTEFRSDGYYYIVRVNAGAGDLGKRLNVQIYDPAFVQQGDTCTDFVTTDAGGTATDARETETRNALNALDASSNADRYDTRATASDFCPGDHFIRAGYHNDFPTTIVQPRTFDQTPWQSTDNAPITATGCAARTFAPLGGLNDTNALSMPNLLSTTYVPPAADSSTYAATAPYAREVFHRWVSVCDATLSSLGINAAGTYDIVLQMRTTGGAGHNRYAIRAGLADTAGATAADGSHVSLFADKRLPMYMNASGSDTQFYLARIFPGSDGRKLQVQFFDVGDASPLGNITVLPPSDATVSGAPIATWPCTFSASFSINFDASTCTLTGVNAANGYQGALVTATIPIPNGYDCDDSNVLGCWVRVRFSYASGAVQDTTTWGAEIIGDPVRLVK